jgi:uncharacterized protein YcbX/ferredoxin
VIALSKLFVHPIKSMRGLQLSHAQVTDCGLAFDRLFMLTDAQGAFITARQYPEMVQFTPAIMPGGIHISTPDGSSLLVRFDDFEPAPEQTEVWGNTFTARIATDKINHWFSQQMNKKVQLRWLGEHPTRRVKKHPAVPLSFADGYPFLLINDASLHDLQQRCPAGTQVEQFRPNLVVSGAEPYAEDSWQTIRVGEVIFDLVKPCSRCVLTTVSPQRGRKHPSGEPLTTLKSYRMAENGDIDFGHNMIARNSGIIRQGDEVEVLASKPARQYITSPTVPVISPTLNEPEALTISYQGQQFSANNQLTILEQLEQHNLRLPYSCRAGFCGCCKVKLQAGEVTALKEGVITDDGEIFTCSCIPKTSITLA